MNSYSRRMERLKAHAADTWLRFVICDDGDIETAWTDYLATADDPDAAMRSRAAGRVLFLSSSDIDLL